MKKIIVCMCLVLFIGTAYGQGVFVFKYYYNYEKGWTGEAAIAYLCNDANGVWEILQSEGAYNMTSQNFREKGVTIWRVEKLSEREWWLIWSVLGEYNTANKEIYQIGIKKGRGLLCVWVRIQNNGKSVNWFAYGY